MLPWWLFALSNAQLQGDYDSLDHEKLSVVDKFISVAYDNLKLTQKLYSLDMAKMKHELTEELVKIREKTRSNVESCPNLGDSSKKDLKDQVESLKKLREQDNIRIERLESELSDLKTANAGLVSEQKILGNNLVEFKQKYEEPYPCVAAMFSKLSHNYDFNDLDVKKVGRQIIIRRIQKNRHWKPIIFGAERVSEFTVKVNRGPSPSVLLRHDKT